MSKRYEVHLESESGVKTLNLSRSEGTSACLSDLLRERHLPLNTRCGKRGLCDGCLVELVQGDLEHARSGEAVAANGHPVRVRGCEYRLAGAETVVLRIPSRSVLAYEPQVVTEYRVNVPVAHDPICRQIPLPAGLTNGDAIARHVSEQIRRPARFEAPALERPTASGAVAIVEDTPVTGWAVTRLLERQLKRRIGVAVDVGTTTVALMLVDLDQGKIVSRASGFNKQMHLGDDVVTRINLCTTDPTMVRGLQQALNNETLEPLLREAAEAGEVSLDEIVCFSVAGNTTMLHLLAGVDPSPMGVAPFTPAFLERRLVSAASIEMHSTVPPDASVHLLPSAAAYIGADLSAGVFSSGLLYDEGPSLLVDIGTNGEIILKHDGKLLGCATAAGPAFEGGGLECGMRAGRGAISRVGCSVVPSFDVALQIIGEDDVSRPAGLCGSAYVDFLAEARRCGVLTGTGRFDSSVPGADQRLIDRGECGRALRLAKGHGNQPVVVSERDVARLLQAKAAIAAGILTLVHRAGLQPDDVKRLYLAGGFGMHLDVRHAIACGLLPGFVAEQVQVVGNTSLAGAHLALLDSAVLDELSKIAHQVDVVELNLDPDFQDRYIDQLSLPDLV